MNKLKLAGTSILPLIWGLITNYGMMNFGWRGNILFFNGLLFLVGWYGIGYISHKYSKSRIESIVTPHILGAMCLLAIITYSRLWEYTSQIGVLAWINVLSQYYFLPLIRVIASIQTNILFFLRMHLGYISMVLSYLLMVGVYYLGYKTQEKWGNN